MPRTFSVAVGPQVASGGGDLLGWELTTSNVGLAGVGVNGASLPTYVGTTTPTPGTVITERKITTPLDMQAGGITLDRCLIQPTTVGVGSILLTCYGGSLTSSSPISTVKDCDIDSSQITDDEARAFCVGMHGIANMYRNYIHGGGGGFATYGAGNYGSAVVENNYVTGMFAWGDPAAEGNHVDAFTVRDFTNAVVPGRSLAVINNRFDCDSANATGAYFIQTTFGSTIANVTTSGNLFEGNGWNVGLEQISGGTVTNCSLDNNRWVAGSGQWYGYQYSSGGVWSSTTENYQYSASADGGRGAPIVF